MNPLFEAVRLSVAGPFPAKLIFVVLLSKTYAPLASEVVVATGLLLQPLEQVIVTPESGGFPGPLLTTIPEIDVAAPSVNVICACDAMPRAIT